MTSSLSYPETPAFTHYFSTPNHHNHLPDEPVTLYVRDIPLPPAVQRALAKAIVQDMLQVEALIAPSDIPTGPLSSARLLSVSDLGIEDVSSVQYKIPPSPTTLEDTRATLSSLETWICNSEDSSDVIAGFLDAVEAEFIPVPSCPGPSSMAESLMNNASGRDTSKPSAESQCLAADAMEVTPSHSQSSVQQMEASSTEPSDVSINFGPIEASSPFPSVQTPVSLLAAEAERSFTACPTPLSPQFNVGGTELNKSFQSLLATSCIATPPLPAAINYAAAPPFDSVFVLRLAGSTSPVTPMFPTRNVLSPLNGTQSSKRTASNASSKHKSKKSKTSTKSRRRYPGKENIDPNLAPC